MAKAKLEIDVKSEILIKGLELSFHYLAEPCTTGQYPDNAYKADLFVKKPEFKEKCKELMVEIQKAGAQLHGKPMKWQDCTDSVVDMDDGLTDEDEYKQYKEGRMRIRVKSKKIIPAVINADKTPASKEDIKNIRMGDIVNVLVNIYPWERTDEVEVEDANGKITKKKRHQKKVSLGLIAVQLVRKGEGGNNLGKAQSVFEDESLVESTEDSVEDAAASDEMSF